MTEPVTLPQELVNLIIQLVAARSHSEDKQVYKTLLACTLVNKSFSAAARPFCLQEVIVYEDPNKVESLLASLKSDLYPDPRPLIQSLRISVRQRSPDVQIFTTILPFLSSKKIQLRRLEISFDGEAHRGQEPALSSWCLELCQMIYTLGRSSSLTTLHLRDVHISLSSISQDFPNLRTLILENNAQIRRNGGPTDPNHLSQLEALEFRSYSLSNLMIRMLSVTSHPFHNLKRLRLEASSRFECYASSFWRLLNACGGATSLETLEL